MPSDKTPWTFNELDAASLDQYTTIVYEVWKGDRADPATQVEEWLSVFKTEDMPDENYLVAKVPRYSYRDEFEGLLNTVHDTELRVVKKTDHAALQHQKESEQLLPDPEGSGYNYHRNAQGKVQYEDFLEAIDKVAENDDDEEAWQVIETWRTRRLRQEERSL